MRAAWCIVLLLGLLVSAGAQGPSPDSVLLKLNTFARTYKKFAAQHDRGIFDVALAKQLSKEWRAVENSGEWPR